MPVCLRCTIKLFRLITAERECTFDSFECAIHAVAPICAHCGCRIIGHGMETQNRMFYCAYCAEQEGRDEFRDRA